MDMLNKFHQWVENKTCRLRGDYQLDRQVRLAYRHVEPPTPVDQLRAQLLARAENRMQLPSLHEPVIAHQPETPITASVRQSTHKSLAWRQQLLDEKNLERRRSSETRQTYRQIMDFAMHQMHLNLIDSNIYFV